MALCLKDKGLKRLTIDIEIEIHSDIKARAAFRHTSVKNYILEAVAMRMLKESEYLESIKRSQVK
jgi:hypothetical protein